MSDDIPEVPILEDRGALPDGTRFYIFGAREEGGAIELVGFAADECEAEELARAIIEGKNWTQAMIAEHKVYLSADLSKVRQVKHPAGWYYFEPREEKEAA